MSASFTELSEGTFHSQVQKGVVLVDFYAQWCGPCRMLAPILEKIAIQLAPKVTIAKLDIEKAQNTASSYQVNAFPTLILFKNGKEVGRLVGLRDEKTIKDFIQLSENK